MVAAASEFLYLWSRVPGGTHQVTAAELTKVAVDREGTELGLDVTARLPWGDGLSPGVALRSVAASHEAALAVPLPREILILR